MKYIPRKSFTLILLGILCFLELNLFQFRLFLCPYNLYKTASRHFVNLFLLLYLPVGEYKGMSRQILPITMSDFLYSLV